MKIKLIYNEFDQDQVKKVFDTLLVWHGGDSDKVISDMDNNNIALSNKQNWEIERKKEVQTATVWSEGIYVSVGQNVTYNGNTYQVIQSHTTQADWQPPNVPALYRYQPIVLTGENYPRWIQPLGSHDAYASGSRVTHNGEDWESDIDANVWEPGGSQWTSLTNPPAGPEPWVQPTGGHDAYNMSDQVTHNGSTWESVVDANVWEPGVYGWIEI